LYSILQCKIQPPEKNLAAVELFFYGWIVAGRIFFRRIFGGRKFSATAAKFGGWGSIWQPGFFMPLSVTSSN